MSKSSVIKAVRHWHHFKVLHTLFVDFVVTQVLIKYHFVRWTIRQQDIPTALLLLHIHAPCLKKRPTFGLL